MKFLDKILGFLGIETKESQDRGAEIRKDFPSESSVQESKTTIMPGASREDGEISEDKLKRITPKKKNQELSSSQTSFKEDNKEVLKEKQPREQSQDDIKNTRETLHQKPARSVEELEKRMKGIPKPKISAEQGGPAEEEDKPRQ